MHIYTLFSIIFLIVIWHIVKSYDIKNIRRVEEGGKVIEAKLRGQNGEDQYLQAQPKEKFDNIDYEKVSVTVLQRYKRGDEYLNYGDDYIFPNQLRRNRRDDTYHEDDNYLVSVFCL